MKKPLKETVSFPIRMDAHLDKMIDEAVEISGMKKAELIRIALAAGLEDMKQEQYNLGRIISKMAHPALHKARKAEGS